MSIGEIPLLLPVFIRSILSSLSGWLEEVAVMSSDMAKLPSRSFSVAYCETALTELSPGFCCVKRDRLVPDPKPIFCVEAMTSTISSFSPIAFLIICTASILFFKYC